MDPTSDNLVEFSRPGVQEAMHDDTARPNPEVTPDETPVMRQRGEFVSIRQIVHEYNNLFTILQGNLRIIIDTDDSLSQDTLETIEDALSAAMEGAELTKALRELAEKQR